jgi:hypothetical protein
VYFVGCLTGYRDKKVVIVFVRFSCAASIAINSLLQTEARAARMERRQATLHSK